MSDRECIVCSSTIEEHMSKTSEFCSKCMDARLLNEIFNSKHPKPAVFKLRPGWTFKAQANLQMYEKQYMNLEVHFQGKIIEIDISEYGDGQRFIVGVGDKQFVVEPTEEQPRHSAGKVTEQHDSFWMPEEV